jgi:hypothetical protein
MFVGEAARGRSPLAPARSPPRPITTDPTRQTRGGALVHMVEGYVRHNGHADLLRERIDGRIGQ